MGRNNYFQFKQFKIIQEKAAMKVGTDGALLGAWVNVGKVNTLLDIGTGTGLIALMLAQRSSAEIVGIEIEAQAAEEAAENVSNSPWKDRIAIENISFQQLVKTANQKFDLIVSNPPFFTNSYKNENKKRTTARHNDLLPFFELISGTCKLLNEKGRLALILPNESANEVLKLASGAQLFVSRITRIKPRASKDVNRYLIEFSKCKGPVMEDELIIYTDKGTGYTEAYKKLTRDFYIKF